MQTLVYVLVATLATLASVGAMTTRLDAQTRLIMAMLGAVLWARWALASFRITALSGGTEFVYSYPGFVYLGGALSAIMLLVVARYALGQLGEESAEEVRQHV